MGDEPGQLVAASEGVQGHGEVPRPVGVHREHPPLLEDRQQLAGGRLGLLVTTAGQERTSMERQGRQLVDVPGQLGELDGGGGVGQGAGQVGASQPDRPAAGPAEAVRVGGRARLGLGDEPVGAGQGRPPVSPPVVVDGALGLQPAKAGGEPEALGGLAGPGLQLEAAGPAPRARPGWWPGCRRRAR
jgi:hypothetical protein